MNQWIQCGHPGCVMQIGHPGPHYTTSYGGAAGTPLGPMPWAPLHSHAEWQAMEAEVDRLHSELASARTVERKDLYEQIERLRAALTGLEWIFDDHPLGWWCPECGNEKDTGHLDVCTLRSALAIDAAVEKFIKREDAHAPLVENRPALLALRNVRMLVRRKWGKGIDEEWAEHLIRFCREGGLTDDILRAPRPDDGKTGGGK